MFFKPESMFKKYSIKAFFAIVALCTSLSAKAQDPEFTQFYANPLYLNPAFAGSAKCARIVMNYRNQWPALTGTFVTYNASYDQHFKAIGGGIGLLVNQDYAGQGTLITTNASAMYAPTINITREFSIKMAVQATYHQKKVDWDKLTFGDMIDPRRGFVYTSLEQRKYTSVSMFDVSAGILGYSQRYYFGFAMNHLTEPNEGFLGSSKLPIKYTGHAGAMIPLDGGKTMKPGEGTFISPNILFQKQQDFRQLNLGFYLMKGPLVGGFWYRHEDAFIALIGIQKGMIKCGYSYDITVSKLANATAGSHEISFQTIFVCKQKQKKYRTVSCPSF